MKISKKAVTLVEISIGIIIFAILMTVILKLLTSGMKGSSKGLAHQANMESASIIMAQIEYDLLRASSIEFPASNETAENAKWDFYAASGGGAPVTVIYDVNSSGGVNRKVDANGSIQNTVLGKDHNVTLNFTHFLATPAPTAYAKLGKEYLRRHAMWVEITVSTKNDKKIGANESISLRRLIVVRSSL